MISPERGPKPYRHTASGSVRGFALKLSKRAGFAGESLFPPREAYIGTARDGNGDRKRSFIKRRISEKFNLDILQSHFTLDRFRSHRKMPFAQLLQQQQNTITIARIMIQVQLSSKRWHRQLLFIYVFLQMMLLQVFSLA